MNRKYQNIEEKARILEEKLKEPGGEILKRILEDANFQEQESKVILPPTFTADELLKMTIPAPVEIIPGILVEGVSGLIGKPKTGKSWFAFQTAVGVASGAYVLGSIPVEKRGVLYLALEDTRQRLQTRLRALLQGSPAPPDLYIAREWPRLNEGGDIALDAFLMTHPEVKLVVVDILERIRESKVNDRGKTLYSIDYQTIAKLKTVVDRHRASLLFVHHTNRRDPEDPIDMISGSTGIAGACDSILILKRARGKADAELFITGRDIEERILALRADPHVGGWVLLGDAEEYRLSKERQAVIEALRNNDGPLSPKELAIAIGKPYENVKMLLSRMAKDGEVKVLDRGKYTLQEKGKKESYYGYHDTKVTSVTTVTSERGSEKVTEGNRPPVTFLGPETLAAVGVPEKVTEVTEVIQDAVTSEKAKGPQENSDATEGLQEDLGADSDLVEVVHCIYH